MDHIRRDQRVDVAPPSGESTEPPHPEAGRAPLTRPSGHGRRSLIPSSVQIGLLVLLAAVAVRDAAAQTAPQSFWATVEQKERGIYFAALENGDAENWFGGLVASWATEVTLSLTHLDPAAPSAAQIEVQLQGVTTDDTVAPDHRVAVFVNDLEVGELTFDGRERGTGRFAVPHAVLRDGANTVGLVARGAVDYSLVDAVRLSYWHTYHADADQLRFTLDGPQRIRVRGVASEAIRLLDITDPAAPHAVEGLVASEPGGAWSVLATVAGHGTRTLLAFTEATVATPAVVEANTPSSWHTEAQASDYLLITHDTFAPALEPLVALRAGQGHAAALIDIEDVYDEFSFGQKDPQALKDFLTRARTSWRRPPAYVVLAGDATIDPRDYAGFGDADFVPTKLIAMDTVELETSTDDWFADQDGDGLADLAVGRLPIRTLAHAETMVSKLVSYEQEAAGAWTKEVLLLADADDEKWSFAAGNAQLKATLPDDYTVNEVFGDAGTAGARAEVFDHVRDGQLLVNYLGHGSTTVWGKHGDLLTSADLAGGWNPDGRLPLVVAMNCLNGLFHGIYGEESLAETFLRAPGGAVATWASSSVTHAHPQKVANQEFFRLLFAGAYPTLGETLLAAKAVVADRDVRRSWIFFGDPAMRLKGVSHAPAARDRLTQTPTTAPIRAAADPTETTPADPDDAEATGAPADQVAQHLADFTGDGRDDLFTYAPQTGTWTLALAEGDITGTWAANAQLFAAHLDDDRLADLFAYNAETGDWFQAFNNADGTFTTHAGAWAPGWQVTGGDVDGNGRDDVFLSDPETGVWFQAATTAPGGFTYRSGQGLPAGGVHLADFTGDRHADLFVYDPTTGRWFVGVNDTAGGFTYVGGDGAPEWRAAVANLDCNTWADLFLFHPASGAWVEWRTDTAGQIAYAQGTWTTGGAVTVADLDGDGRDDLFFYDADTGAWSRYLTAPAPGNGVVPLEDAGTWATGLALVGRPE